MQRVLLVSDAQHSAFATYFAGVLRRTGRAVSVFDTDSSLRNTIAFAAKASTCVWLVSSETTTLPAYRKLRRLIHKRGLRLIPVLVDAGAIATVANGHYLDATNHPKQAIRQTLRVLRQLHPSPHGPPISIWNRAALVMMVAVVLTFLLAFLALVLRPGNHEQPLPTRVRLALDPTAVVSGPVEADRGPVHQAVAQQHTATVPPTLMSVSHSVTVSPEPESTEMVGPLSESTDEATPDTSSTPDSLLIADFSVVPSYGDAPLLVSIENKSSGTIESFEWDFNGDGVVDSTGADPGSTVFSTPGFYAMSLTVRDALGRSAQSQILVEVFQEDTGPNPVLVSGPYFASFLASPTTGQAPLTVTFINRSEGTNLGFLWDFNGDLMADSTSASPPGYTYAQPGTYQANLTVTGANGTHDVAQTVITVYSNAPEDDVVPIYDEDSQASFTVSSQTGVAPLRVEVSNQSAGVNNLYEWDFDGDGRPDSAAEDPPSFTYQEPGSYPLTLTVRGYDRYGLVKQTQAQITVVVSPPEEVGDDHDDEDEDFGDSDLLADFVVDLVQGPAPLTVNFFNYSEGAISGFTWDFDDDGVVDSTDADPMPFTYTTPGTYEATLMIGDGISSDSTSIVITVLESETPTVSATSTWTATPTATLTWTPTLSLTPSATLTLTPTLSLTPSAKFSLTPTPSLTPSATFTETPTATATQFATLTETPTETNTATDPPTETATVTEIPSETPTLTETVTETPSQTATMAPSETPSPTFTLTATETATPIPTATFTETPLPPDTPAETPTLTVTPSPTLTATPTETDAPEP